MRKKRWCSLLLALALALSLALPAAAAETESPLLPAVRTYAGQFTDLENAWCREEAVTVYEAGLMEGKSAARFDIQGNLTYAQITVITARLSDLLTGGDGSLGTAADGEPWYQPAAEYLTEALADADSDAALYLLEDLSYLDNFADQSCDRYDFVWYLAAVLPEEALAPINHITSLPDTTDGDILRFYQAGILTGSDDKGTFDGFALLTRGQAAAMLARIVDPARRVTFSLTAPCYTREALGLEPDAVMLTVDGYAVSADLYLYFLATNIQDMKDQQAYGFYDTYPQYLQEYMADSAYTGSFEEFLLERYGIDVTVPVAWNTPDKGGMSPAQKVLQDTLDDLKELAALMNHQEEYPLTQEQKTELEEYLSTWGIPYGFSEAFYQEMLTAMLLAENIVERYQLTSPELTELLAEEGYIYGQYVAIYRGERGGYESDEAAKAAAEAVRQKLIAHLDDPEYVEFLIWKYSGDYNIAPDLLPANVLSDASFQTLKNLGVNQVSPVLAEEDFYMVVIKLDPASNEDLMASIRSVAAQARLAQWAQDAQVTTSAAYDALDVAAIAQTLEKLGF